MLELASSADILSFSIIVVNYIGRAHQVREEQWCHCDKPISFLVKTEGILYNNKLVRNKIALVQALFYVTCCPLSRMFIVHLNLIIF